MLARASSGPRMECLRSLYPVLFRRAALPGALLFCLLLSSPLFASSFGDASRQLADRISAVSGPGTLTLDISNRSSLDEKAVREIRGAIEQQLRVRGVRSAAADQSMGSLNIVLSESLRDYVWTAEIAVGSDAPRIVLVSLPRDLSATAVSSVLPITLKKNLLFTQQQPILDAALLDMPGGARLFVLDASRVASYRQQSGHWELETSLPITTSRPLPRDTRGRLVLRRDHLFDAYLPGTVCRSSVTAPLAMNCSRGDDLWPLTAEDSGSVPGPRAFFAPQRNFFTGVLSPGIGKISNVPSFYSAAALPRSNYVLWVLAAVDGTVHLVDGMNDQTIRGLRIGSDLASVRSGCGLGSQLLVSQSGDATRDALRALEIPDREPVTVSPPVEFDGAITALWPETNGQDALRSDVNRATSGNPPGAIAIVKRSDTGWYEANRISITCAN